MPYKDKVKQKEAGKERVRRYRDKQKGVTSEEGVTEGGTFFLDGVEMVSASYVEGIKGRLYEMLPAKARFLELSDGQVLDRSNLPVCHPSGDFILRMRNCNEGKFNFRPLNKGVL